MKGMIIVTVAALVIFLAWYMMQQEDNDNGDDIPPDSDYNDTIPSQCEYNTGLGTIECHYEKTGSNTRSLSIRLPEHMALTLSGEFKIGGSFSSIVKIWVIDVDGQWHKIFEGEGDAQHSYPFATTLNYIPKRIKIEGNKDFSHYGDYIDLLKVHITYYDWRFGQ